MSFRRMPFQFSTNDPVERQRELERRFGLPSNRNMFVDVVNPLSTGTVPKDSNISSNSPRLQHRVPIFIEGYDQPIQSSVDSAGVIPENKKPNVRVIPIEVEGAERRPITRERGRTLSGPAGKTKDQNDGCLTYQNGPSPQKRSMVDLSGSSMMKSSTLPRVHNIPIQVESACDLKNPTMDKTVKSPKVNGCTVTKSKVKSPDENHKRKLETNKVQTEEEKQKSILENSMKKIKIVLEELKSYESGVQEFSGTTKDKQYRYLDEMLTRCMLKMDEIDTMGNENLRSARKNAIKKIQACIDLLESKANAVSEVLTTASSQDEVKTSEGHELSKTVENQDELTCQNDVKMTELTVEKEIEKNVFQKTDVEMTGSHDAELDPEKNLVISDDASQDEVEMTENQSIECDGSNKKISPNVISSQDEITNQCKIMVTEKPSAELSSEVSEVEMAEIKTAISSECLNSEIPEVEMTDNVGIQNIDLDNTVSLNKEKVQIQNLQPELNASQGDIEMKEVESTLDDLKETVLEDKSEKCVLNQPEKRTETICNSDAEICQNA